MEPPESFNLKSSELPTSTSPRDLLKEQLHRKRLDRQKQPYRIKIVLNNDKTPLNPGREAYERKSTAWKLFQEGDRTSPIVREYVNEFQACVVRLQQPTPNQRHLSRVTELTKRRAWKEFLTWTLMNLDEVRNGSGIYHNPPDFVEVQDHHGWAVEFKKGMHHWCSRPEKQELSLLIPLSTPNKRK